jgi:hypothetical protein
MPSKYTDIQYDEKGVLGSVLPACISNALGVENSFESRNDQMDDRSIDEGVSRGGLICEGGFQYTVNHTVTIGGPTLVYIPIWGADDPWNDIST